MSEYDDFFEHLDTNKFSTEATVPDFVLTEPVSSLLPSTVIYPHSAQYKGVFAIDEVTKSMYININAVFGKEDIDPDSLYARLPLVRILALEDDQQIEGFIVDIRDASATSRIRQEDVKEVNEKALEESEFIKEERFYVPALAIIYETEEGNPGFSGDPRLVEFGRSLLFAANKKHREIKGRRSSELKGTFALFEEVPESAPATAEPEVVVEEHKSEDTAEVVKKKNLLEKIRDII